MGGVCGLWELKFVLLPPGNENGSLGCLLIYGGYAYHLVLRFKILNARSRGVIPNAMDSRLFFDLFAQRIKDALI